MQAEPISEESSLPGLQAATSLLRSHTGFVQIQRVLSDGPSPSYKDASLIGLGPHPDDLI